MPATTVSTAAVPDSSVTQRNRLDEVVAAVNDHAADIDQGFEGVPQDGAVTAAKLDAAVSAVIPGTPTLTPDASGASPQDCAIQLKDSAGADLAAKTLVDVWLSDAAGGAPTASAPDTSVTFPTGTIIATITAGKVFRVLSDATGAIVCRLTHAGADTTWYVNVAHAGVVTSSAAVVVDNP